MDEVVPVLASWPAWKRRVKSRAQAVVEAVGDSIIARAMAKKQKAKPETKVTVEPRPEAAQVEKPATVTKVKTPVAPAQASASDPDYSAVLVGPDLPDSGLFSEGSMREIFHDFASDLAQLNDETVRDVSSSAHDRLRINKAIADGASLAVIKQGKVISIYSSALTPSVAARGKRLPIECDLLTAIDSLGEIDREALISVATEIGGESSPVSGSRFVSSMR